MVEVPLIDRSHFRIVANHEFRKEIEIQCSLTWCGLCTVVRGSDASRYLWEFSRFQLYRSKSECCHAVSEETSAETGPSTQAVCVSVPKQKRSDPQPLVQAPITQPEETDIQLQQSSSPSHQHNTSLQLLIKKVSVSLTLILRVMAKTWEYGTNCGTIFEWQQHTRYHQFNHNVLHEHMLPCLNWPM